MLKNYVKIGFRNLVKNKVYSIINVIGLAIGISASLLIYHLVNYELSFNKNFENYNKIARVVTIERGIGSGEAYDVCVPIPAMDEMENSVSQLKVMTRIRELWPIITIPDPNGGAPFKKFSLDPGETAFFAEPEFFEIFNFQWLAGDPKSALEQPGSIVFTQSWANKCFSNWEQAMGQTVLIDNLTPVVVKGIIADPPKNCDFPLPFIVSYETAKNNRELFFLGDSWGECSSNNQVFTLLSDEKSMSDANDLLTLVGKEEYTQRSPTHSKTHQLQPLADMHYDDRFGHSGTHRISKARLNILFFIGMLILLIACFNFINLATAQSLSRAREVGVRKTLGSSKSQLITQFMSETGLIVLISVVLGAWIASLTSPLLHHISHVPEELQLFSSASSFQFLIMATIGVTVLAGLYPSIVLANYKPVQALTNQVNRSAAKGPTVKNALVVLQFGVALALIIGTIITVLQLGFIKKKDLGFDNELVYTFQFNADRGTIDRQDALKNGLHKIPAIRSISFNGDQPLSGNTWTTNFRYSSRPDDEQFEISIKFCDSEYLNTYGLTLIAGRWLPLSDSMKHIVLNMTAIKKLGLENPIEAIGQPVYLGGGRGKLPIVGVVEYFHTHSLHQEHEPLLMVSRKRFYWQAGLKIHPADIASTTAAIKQVYDEVLPDQVFNGAFLDENLATFYENEERLATTCKAFGLLAILISCLGLFGLATHSVRTRMKEIGVRKVLGADVAGIVGLLSQDFLKLVAIALIIASPVSWFIMTKWLEDFAYRIEVQFWVFLVAGGAAMAIAFFTVSFQSVRAAMANPVESLRNE